MATNVKAQKRNPNKSGDLGMGQGGRGIVTAKGCATGSMALKSSTSAVMSPDSGKGRGNSHQDRPDRQTDAVMSPQSGKGARNYAPRFPGQTGGIMEPRNARK